MRTGKQIISAKLFLFAAFCPFGLFIIGCENSQKQIDDLTKDKVLVEEAKNIKALLSQQGIVKGKLTAPLMLRYERDTSGNPYSEFPKTLHVDFYDSTAKIQSWLDSKYGKYLEAQNKVYLRDSVIAINITGDTLKTQELWWDQQKEKFYTDKWAELHTKEQLIHGGTGLEASQDLKDITFKEVNGTVKTSDKGFP